MLTVLDIGARGGPDPRWRVLSPEVNVVGVDADAEECVRLNRMTFDVPCRFVSAALGSRDGEAATLHLTRQPGCSSLLEPNHAYLAQFPYGREAFQVVRRIPLTLTRLDTLCLQHAITADVIKIDTQGSELDILRGGEAALQRASLIELEVEFNPLYADQPLFGDLDTYLRMRGFNLLGLRRTAWRRNQNGSLGGTVVHGDALWIRDAILEEVRTRVAAALVAYRQHDLAHALGREVDKTKASSLVQRLIGRLIAQWPHRQLRAWIDRSRPEGGVDWHDPDFF